MRGLALEASVCSARPCLVAPRGSSSDGDCNNWGACTCVQTCIVPQHLMVLFPAPLQCNRPSCGIAGIS